MTQIKGKRTLREWPCQKCGWCCENVLMDTELVDKNRHLFQKPVKAEVISKKIPGKTHIVFTDTNEVHCVFLKSDNKCAIYNDRPKVCREFGLSGADHECPNVAPSGRIRSPEEATRAKIRIFNNNDKKLKEFTKMTGFSINSMNEDE